MPKAAKKSVKELKGYALRKQQNEIKVRAQREADRARQEATDIQPPERLMHLRWQQPGSKKVSSGVIDLDHCVLRKSDDGPSWAVGSPLPRSGKFSWHIRIDHSHNNNGVLLIGVCDSGGTIAYALAPCTGALHRITMGGANDWVDHGGPNVMVDERGRPCTLQRKANGSVVEVIIDVHLGALSFRVNSGRILPALVGLPRADELRPCVGLRRIGDQVTMLCRPGDEVQGIYERRRDCEEYTEFVRRKRVFLSLAATAAKVSETDNDRARAILDAKEVHL